MNIAIFGGSFDPPHNGHDAIVHLAISNLDIDKLIIVPTFLSRFKTSFLANPIIRLNWCKKLWAKLKKVEVSAFEISQKRAVPSIQTVLYFKKTYNPKKIFLIIGADQLENLEKWYKFSELANLVDFVVASRDNIKIPPNLQKLDINAKISSTKIRDGKNFYQIPTQILDEVKEFYKDKNAK